MHHPINGILWVYFLGKAMFGTGAICPRSVHLGVLFLLRTVLKDGGFFVHFFRGQWVGGWVGGF